MTDEYHVGIIERWWLRKPIRQKTREFQKLGYPNVREQELWEYVFSYKWKKQEPATVKEKKKYIATIRVNDFFDYQQIKAQVKIPEELDWQKIHDLL